MENIILYNTEDGKASVKLYAENNTVWLTQAQMAELFDKNISTISRHVTNIFDENEVDKKAICVLCKLQILIDLLLCEPVPNRYGLKATIFPRSAIFAMLSYHTFKFLVFLKKKN